MNNEHIIILYSIQYTLYILYSIYYIAYSIPLEVFSMSVFRVLFVLLSNYIYSSLLTAVYLVINTAVRPNVCYVIRDSAYNICRILFSVHCTVYSVQWIVYSVYSIQHYVYCIPYSVCIVYTVYTIQGSAHCIWYELSGELVPTHFGRDFSLNAYI